MAERANSGIPLRLVQVPSSREFTDAASAAGFWPLKPAAIGTLQINVGKLCNQTCRHCHVDAGPTRREIMTRDTVASCLRALDACRSITTVDITGGAPELNPHFRYLVDEAAARGLHVMDRCNLTVLLTPAQADLPAFFADRKVEVVASLPHYRATGTDAQRGEGVFEKSIAALRRLNEVGYGEGRSGLRLVLVTNPVGAFLPPAQASIEVEWKREMRRLHGITFDALYCITNMPISRYLDWLSDSGNLERYMERLVVAFNPATVPGLMCRTLVSVAWDGRLYDCDFNQMVDLPLMNGAPRHVSELTAEGWASLQARTIAVGRHCFGCTAGAGSSCGGSIK